MKCGVCLHPLRKVSTRTVNKRRVPIYAKCPRLNDPQFHPARAALSAQPAGAPTLREALAAVDELASMIGSDTDTQGDREDAYMVHCRTRELVAALSAQAPPAPDALIEARALLIQCKAWLRQGARHAELRCDAIGRFLAGTPQAAIGAAGHPAQAKDGQ